MQLPIPPKRAERAARKYLLPVLAFLHLSSFPVLRTGDLRGWTKGWAASAFVAAGFLLFRDMATSRKENRLPDVLSLTAWGAAALLELHGLSSVVAFSQVVPAIVFSGVSFLLPALPAVVYASISLVWLLFSPSVGFGVAGMSASIVGMAGIAVVAGRVARWKLAEASGETLLRKPTGHAGSLVSPPENSGKPGQPGFNGFPEGKNFLVRREEELEEGIQRVLEGILPISGGNRIMYVSPSHGHGSPLVARSVTPPEEEIHWRGRELPDAYVPLREAVVFRREFFAEGEESTRWGLPREGSQEQPSGIAAVPVLCDGTEEGAVLSFRFGEGRWTEPVVQVLEMGAFFIAREIAETRRRYRNERFLESQLGVGRLARTIAEAAEKIRREGVEVESASPRREVYKTATEQIRFQLKADRVLLVEAETRKRRGRVAWEATEDGEQETNSERHKKDAWVKLAGTYAEWVLLNNVHRIFSGVRKSPARHPVLPEKWEREDEDSYLLVPVDGGGFRGILVCASREENRNYHKRDVEMVKEVITIMRMGISHAHHIETLEEQATSDGLTGLLNQRTFRKRLSIDLSKLDSRLGCAVIMADIDHFKVVNDTYGHQAGDEVLKNIANIIQKTIRKAVMAARYGGEEFVLYLHNVDREKAKQKAERLRLIIEQMRFEFGGKEVGITASLGIACYPSDGSETRELLERADEALYRSKQGGRNRTTEYRDPV
jgi:diguanylate cyclase (GGDEF)-like protein